MTNSSVTTVVRRSTNITRLFVKMAEQRPFEAYIAGLMEELYPDPHPVDTILGDPFLVHAHAFP